MKKFEQLKRWELEALRHPTKQSLMQVWAKWGMRSYFHQKGDVLYLVGKSGFKQIWIEYLDLRGIRNYQGASSIKRWWVEAGTDSKAYSTLREAYNAARKYILAGVGGDPNNFINQ